MDKSTAAAFVDLERAAIGRPVTRLGVSFFPVYLMDNPPAGHRHRPEVGAGHRGAARRLGADADRGQPHGPADPARRGRAVPRRRPEPHAERQRAGGGRRHPEDPGVVPGGGPVGPPPRLRGGVHLHPPAGASREERGGRPPGGDGRGAAGDQNAVWSSIDAELDDLGVAAPTRAMAAADGVYEREPDRQAAADELGALGPLPGQCGVVVAHGPRVVATEVFGAPGCSGPTGGRWCAPTCSSAPPPPDGPRPAASSASSAASARPRAARRPGWGSASSAISRAPRRWVRLSRSRAR